VLGACGHGEDELKIVCFYGDNPLASWMLSRGLPSVLRRMGHEVVEIPTLGTAKVKRADVERINKPIPQDTDLILVSGPEYLMSWIKTFYPQWKDLKCAKACWYHESEVRDDRVADFAKITPWFDFNFMPNAGDAEKHKATHLPIGVDTEVFQPLIGARGQSIWPSSAPFMKNANGSSNLYSLIWGRRN
jgi:hypothetical protein